MQLPRYRGSNRNYWSLPGHEQLQSPVRPTAFPVASGNAPANEIRDQPETGDLPVAAGKKFLAKTPEPQSSYARREARDEARNFRLVATCAGSLAIFAIYSNTNGRARLSDKRHWHVNVELVNLTPTRRNPTMKYPR